MQEILALIIMQVQKQMISLKYSSQHLKTTKTTIKMNSKFSNHQQLKYLTHKMPKQTNKNLNLNNNKISSLPNKSNLSKHINLMKYSTHSSIWTLTIISKRILFLPKKVIKDQLNNSGQVFCSKIY